MYNVQIVLSRISTVMPWIIPFPAIDVNGDFPDSVLFFPVFLRIIGLLSHPKWVAYRPGGSGEW